MQRKVIIKENFWKAIEEFSDAKRAKEFGYF